MEAHFFGPNLNRKIQNPSSHPPINNKDEFLARGRGRGASGATLESGPGLQARVSPILSEHGGRSPGRSLSSVT